MIDFLKRLVSKEKSKLPVKGSRKLISVYISDKGQQIIIAPIHKNYVGIYYEQQLCSTISYPVDNELLGKTIIENIDLFSIRDENLRDKKRTDWPAYKTSKLKTIKAFENLYFHISISGVNESNSSFSIEGVSSFDNDLTIVSSFVPSENRKRIGELVLKVYTGCISGIGVIS